MFFHTRYSRRYWLIFTILMMFCALRVAAQQVTDFTFSHIGQAEGMYSQRIYSIVQTDDNALWWSTKYGVDRYNGASVKKYSLGKTMISEFGGRTIKLKQSLNSDNTHTLIAFDSSGLVFEYDVMQDRFKLIAEIRQLLGDQVLLNDVLLTRQGMWLAMREGIYFLHGKELTDVMKGVFANCIISTGQQLLFGTRNGVLAYNIGKETRKVGKGERMQVVIPDAVECGYYDNKYNKVWLGAFLGGVKVLPMNAKGSVSNSAAAVDMPSIASHPVRSLYPYDDKTMLVGVDGAGVWCANRQPNAAKCYSGRLLFDANDGPNGALHGNGIYSVIVDCWGSIIIGSYSGGIDIARPVGSTPAIFRHARGTDQSLLNDRVNCVAQMSDGDMVMGTDNGISFFDHRDGKWKHACRGIVITSFCHTPQGSLLAATYGRGVYEITESSVTQRYSAGDGLLKDDFVYSLFYDRAGNLWIGCLDGDLVQVSATGNKYYKLNNVHDIIQLPDGKIAVGTANGLWTIEAQTGEVRQLNYSTESTENISRYITTLYANNNELWIGTDGGGVYIYHLYKRHSTCISVADGLPSGNISSIFPDRRGRIMIATEHGLAFVTQKTPREVVDVNYCYGLYREYSEGAVCSLTDGNILYGSTTGALVINPDNIQKLNYTAKLNLMGISCSNDDDEQFREKVSRMLRDGRLSLDYDQRTFDLHFEAINLRNQYDIAYQYQVGNGPWSKPDTQPYIRFTNLEPGSHQLRLRCVSLSSCGAIELRSDGGIVLDEVLLNIQIAQPWWNSWWMRMIYIGLIALLFWGAWRIYGLHNRYMRLVVSYSELQSATEGEEETEERSENPEPATDDDGAKHFIEQATQHVLDHLSDSSFGIDELCREMAMSRTLFYVRLKSYTGQSPQDFVRIIRLERAAAMLRNGHSVTDAAALTGFDNPKYFSTVFKKYFGTSPSKYC